MARLRPLSLGTETLPDGTTRDRTILVVDHVSSEQIPAYSQNLDNLTDRGLPPTVVFVGDVDLADAAELPR